MDTYRARRHVPTAAVTPGLWAEATQADLGKRPSLDAKAPHCTSILGAQVYYWELLASVAAVGHPIRQLFAGLDVRKLGYACTRWVASVNATHLVLNRG